MNRMEKQSEIQSIVVGPRLTNIELLRMLAMMMVLVVHADFVALGEPSWSMIEASPLVEGGRVFIEISCKVCVNVFIFISGWFGIKATCKGFTSFLFQCIYFYVLLLAVMLLSGVLKFHPMMIARCFWFGESCWFEKAYALLFILSPVLNSFVENANRRLFGMVLVAFFSFEFLYGLTCSTAYINGGYSVVSFIGIYLLAGYIKRYGHRLYPYGGRIYVSSVIVNFLLFIILSRIGKSGETLSYVNPLVIIGAVGLFLWFRGLRIPYNRSINYISKSCFAVYLLHTSPAVWTSVFLSYCNTVYSQFNGIQALVVMGFSLIIIYVIAVVVDQPRKYLWNHITKRIK